MISFHHRIMRLIFVIFTFAELVIYIRARRIEFYANWIISNRCLDII